MESIIVWMGINWVNLLILVGFIVVCYVLIIKGYKEKVAMMCLFLVNVAEEKFGSGTGQIKYQFVQTHLYKNLPSVIKFFLTEDDIDNAIERAVDNLQDWLEKESKGE